MTEQKYDVVITATAEVRDAEGNLISSTPVEFPYDAVPESALPAFGVTAEQIAESKEQNS